MIASKEAHDNRFYGYCCLPQISLILWKYILTTVSLDLSCFLQTLLIRHAAHNCKTDFNSSYFSQINALHTHTHTSCYIRTEGNNFYVDNALVSCATATSLLLPLSLSCATCQQFVTFKRAQRRQRLLDRTLTCTWISCHSEGERESERQRELSNCFLDTLRQWLFVWVCVWVSYNCSDDDSWWWSLPLPLLAVSFILSFSFSAHFVRAFCVVIFHWQIAACVGEGRGCGVWG